MCLFIHIPGRAHRAEHREVGLARQGRAVYITHVMKCLRINDQLMMLLIYQ